MLIQSVLIQSVLIRLLRLASSCPWEPCAGPLPATVHSTTQSTVPTLVRRLTLSVFAVVTLRRAAPSGRRNGCVDSATPR
ncbi:hypothetical protein OHA72_62930 [Dactylosporangium sp. NBC_01737]|uniref:hypothetical protein n=1 Tax=Dactylosporangium sp. NBC_01737 TaxID=2975959 RepID=UPI002E10A299|nr:hypothetical protein OHA72_62930 [Dactylosporangium sp. NBC_01737]